MALANIMPNYTPCVGFLRKGLIIFNQLSLNRNSLWARGYITINEIMIPMVVAPPILKRKFKLCFKHNFD